MKNLLRILALIVMAGLYAACTPDKSTHLSENINAKAKDSVSDYGPVTMVRSVKQARNGDMLIASYSGVWRYDGKLFTNITTSIPAPSFWDVLEDRQGNLWFGTKDSGVYRFDGRAFQHFTIRQGLPSNTALHLFEDKAGNIWIAAGGGACRYDGKTFRNFSTKDGLPNDGVNTFLEDKSGKIWMGTRGDLFQYDGTSFTAFKNNEGKTFRNVWAIIEDQKGNIVFGGSIAGNMNGGSGGVWRYDGSTITKVSEKTASAMSEDKDGNIWTTGSLNPPGARDWALSRYEKNTLGDEYPVVTEIFTKQLMLCRIAAAKDGSIWFGSGKGVYRWDGKDITNFQPTYDEILKVDPKESRITWKGSMKLTPKDKHVGYVSVSEGELKMEKNRLVGGNVIINMNSIEYSDTTDENTPVKHLKSEDYFDVKRFPFASLVIAEVDTVDAIHVHITGYLTIKNATRLVSFPATIEVKNGTVHATASLILDRTNWGINFSSGKFYKMLADEIVSDEMEFVVEMVGRK